MTITVELLQALLMQDAVATLRTPAEAHLATLTPLETCRGCLDVLSQQAPLHVRHLAAVLLRRAILRLDAVAAFLPPLLQWHHVESTRSDSSVTLVHALEHCLAEVCASLETSQNDSVVATLLSTSTSTTLWTAVAERAPRAFGASGVVSRLPIYDTTPLAASLALLVAAATAVQSTTHEETLSALGTHYLVPLLPRIVVASTLQTADTDVWTHLIQLAEDVPDVLASCLDAVLDTCRQCLRTQSLPVVHMVVALLSHFRHAPWHLVEPSLHVCWRILWGDASGHDEPKEPTLSLHEIDTVDYATTDDDDDQDDCHYAEWLVSHLLRTRPDHGLAVLLPLVSDALAVQSQSPRPICVALSTLGLALEAIPVASSGHVEPMVAAAVAALTSHTSALVHGYAVRLLGVVCETTTGSHSVEHWTIILRHVTQATRHASPAVAARASHAMVSYSRACTTDNIARHVLVEHVAHVVPALSDLLTDQHVVVRWRAVGALARVAHVVGAAAIAPWYSTVMPRLWAQCGTMDQIDASYEHAQLAGASLEAATWMGQVVSEEDASIFGADAPAMMAFILVALENSTDDNGRLPRELLWASCARIASVLRDDYAPYLDRVVPHLMRRVVDTTDVEFTEGDVSGLDAARVVVDEDKGTESMTVAVPGQGLTKVTIHTTKLQEKAQAMRAMYEHAVAVPEGFGPYCQPCLDMCVPLVAFTFSSDIRVTAAQTLAAVFDAACRSELDLPPVYVPRLITALSRQMNDEDADHVDVLLALATSLSDVCESVYAYRFDGQGQEMVRYLTETEVEAVVQHVVHALTACLQRRERLTSAVREALSGDERNDLERTLLEEQELLTPLVDSIGYLLKCFGPRFVPLFASHVAPTLGPHLASGYDARARWSAVCLFDDCVEHCGAEAAATFGPLLLTGILQGWNASSDPDLQRAAIYGIAQLARHAPASILASHASLLAPGLLNVIHTNRDNDADLGRAIYENAVSALASMILFVNTPFRTAGLVNLDAVVDAFVQSLPLQVDEDEAQWCHDEWCTLLEQGGIRVKPDELVRIVNEILSLVNDGHDVATPETCHRLQLVVHQVQHSPTSVVPGADASSAFAHLVSP